MTDSAPRGAGWESFWSRAPGAAALTDEGALAFLRGWWEDRIFAALPAAAGANGADLACGAGVVSTWLADVCRDAGRPLGRLYCVDYSASAAQFAAARSGGSPIVADLAATGFADESFDVIVSQFGVEYAGEGAFLEAVRTLARGGVFIALVHDAEGAIAAECRENLTLFDDLTETEFLAAAGRAFSAGFAADRGEAAGAAALPEAFRSMQSSALAYDRIISRQNNTQAMAFARQIRQDAAIMFNRRRAYADNDVAQWLGSVSGELERSRARFRAMVSSAMTLADAEKLAAKLEKSGFSVEPPRQVRTRSGASIGIGFSVRRPV